MRQLEVQCAIRSAPLLPNPCLACQAPALLLFRPWLLGGQEPPTSKLADWRSTGQGPAGKSFSKANPRKGHVRLNWAASSPSPASHPVRFHVRAAVTQGLLGPPRGPGTIFHATILWVRTAGRQAPPGEPQQLPGNTAQLCGPSGARRSPRTARGGVISVPPTQASRPLFSSIKQTCRVPF